MCKCEDCGKPFYGRESRYEDVRPTPLAEGYCLCVYCFRDACREAICEYQSEIERVTDLLIEHVNPVER